MDTKFAASVEWNLIQCSKRQKQVKEPQNLTSVPKRVTCRVCGTPYFVERQRKPTCRQDGKRVYRADLPDEGWNSFRCDVCSTDVSMCVPEADYDSPEKNDINSLIRLSYGFAKKREEELAAMSSHAMTDKKPVTENSVPCKDLSALYERWVREASDLHEQSESGQVLYRAALKGAATKMLEMAIQLRSLVQNASRS